VALTISPLSSQTTPAACHFADLWLRPLPGSVEETPIKGLDRRHGNADLLSIGLSSIDAFCDH
jgi:hypothetical protein